MADDPAQLLLAAFHTAASEVPAYAQLLAEAGIDHAGIRDMDDFRKRVPVVDKQATFSRFPVAQLCRNGQLGRLEAVLTSSGHSGRFAFGIYESEGMDAAAQSIDDVLDLLFHVKSSPTLVINCLPMGVKVYTRACALAETSVRADMATALVKQFGGHFEQMLLVGEAAFIKHVLELGLSQGIDWPRLAVRLIVGEEPLAENARKYLQGLLGIDPLRPETGLVLSSMGVAELGLNLFMELPSLVRLRRALHEQPPLRQAVLGRAATCVPMIFTYDPLRIYVETDQSDSLIISTLETRRLPLIRYRTGDVAEFLPNRAALAALTAHLGCDAACLGQLPILLVRGRGDHVLAGEIPVLPEEVKEGIYHEPALAATTTANFRLSSGPARAGLKIQLSPGVSAQKDLPERFSRALASYVRAPLAVTCEPYETFLGGMALDYERKFEYIAAK